MVASSYLGAVTWGDGSTGIDGTVTADDSLMDVSYAFGQTGPLVVPLPNGDYVVVASGWNESQGAVRWCDGTAPTTGNISAQNSMIGTIGDAPISDVLGSGGVTVLSNGNYVIKSPNWNNEEGAITWCSGTTATIGTASPTNSLVGSARTGGFFDQLGGGTAPYLGFGGGNLAIGGVTALANGNYVVFSPDWDGDVGAVTWGDGTVGTSGMVSAANSLVGTFSGDFAGAEGVVALPNGNYLVDSPFWNNTVGAVTWGNGSTGISGTISAANSLVGSDPGDQVGGGVENQFGNGYVFVGGVFALSNGNYVVASPNWSGGSAAATWGSGTQSTGAALSAGNSLTGFAGGDGGQLGVFGVTALPEGNYLVSSVPGGVMGDNVTWVDGSSGTTLDGENVPDPENSFYGYAGGAISVNANDTMFVHADAGSGSVSGDITDPNELTYALGQGQTITVASSFLTRALDSGEDVTIQSNDDITIDSPIVVANSATAGSLTLDAGRSILINADINTGGGNLSLVANDSARDGVINSDRDAGAADITLTSGAQIDTGGASLTINLGHSNDKTNSDRGSLTLLGVAAESFALPSGTTIGVSLSGTIAGDGVTFGTYTQLDISGSINLNNAGLLVSASQSFAAGTQFTIVQSGKGVSGTFKGLPEGSTVFSENGSAFVISYRADGGDAVVLTTLTPAPVITGISPASGPAAGGTEVVIVGANLAGVTAVDFGTVQVTSFVSVTDTSIFVMSPPGSNAVPMTVVTPEGTSSETPAAIFTYITSTLRPAQLSLVSGRGDYAEVASLTSTLTAGGVPLPGEAITYSLVMRGSTTVIGAGTTDASGVATFNYLSLAGINAGSYAGAIVASFAGDANYSGASASGTLTVNSVAPPPLFIIGEQAIFRHTGKKKGKLALSGFLFQFSAPLDQTSATTGGNFVVDSITTKRIKKRTQIVLHPIKAFALKYNSSNDSVTLTFNGKQTFPTGGQITVLARTATTGVTAATGATLTENTVFLIPRGGHGIHARY